MTNRTETKIAHGIYDVIFDNFYWRNPKSFIAGFPFRDLIYTKAKKWGREYPLIHFTIGNDGDIWAISILHPWDKAKYKLKHGLDIVRGRINRQLGLMKRPTYDRIEAKDEDGELLLDSEGYTIYKEVPPYIITGDQL